MVHHAGLHGMHFHLFSSADLRGIIRFLFRSLFVSVYAEMKASSFFLSSCKISTSMASFSCETVHTGFCVIKVLPCSGRGARHAGGVRYLRHFPHMHVEAISFANLSVSPSSASWSLWRRHGPALVVQPVEFVGVDEST
jgi:hypothetical protein